MPTGPAVLAKSSVRRFEIADLPTLQRLVSEMQDFEREIDPRLRPGGAIALDYTAAMLRRCDSHDGVVLLADVAGQTVGFVCVLPTVPHESLDEVPGSHALVSDLGVTPSVRGRGVGRALLEAAETYARSRGAAELRIAVLEGNRPAAHLYESAGFDPYLVILAKPLTE
jgi:ribosomal protein S18 acetylase RimI-like enzyme